METKAINRYIGTSPRKMRLVIDLIRGKGVEEALSILHFTTKHAAKTAEKVLRSAISNAQNKEESGRVDTATLYVKEAFVDGGCDDEAGDACTDGTSFPYTQTFESYHHCGSAA